ncbi:MAG: hypothetical protein COV34_02580 [Candidatus Zambryskibacteria bacterium CG10_big_fil_rev_8_21_14_0_10_42_12]|uniref:Uncharacterized protein n=1 Tax=Candidatus Zambryskibacteria bacterium CG10_big_fil_rev_8_21_14_0_10_42_12 TaxID=1975115 RepID=A0A2H0QUI4_9BACT|nr:MAG: hypothetical protein COV34_02580 [Candidatus Zambryskibacteria bacterium CG10_big_fil_rev_8_21_14_0_10_42_12]
MQQQNTQQNKPISNTAYSVRGFLIPFVSAPIVGLLLFGAPDSTNYLYVYIVFQFFLLIIPALFMWKNKRRAYIAYMKWFLIGFVAMLIYMILQS